MTQTQQPVDETIAFLRAQLENDRGERMQRVRAQQVALAYEIEHYECGAASYFWNQERLIGRRA